MAAELVDMIGNLKRNRYNTRIILYTQRCANATNILYTQRFLLKIRNSIISSFCYRYAHKRPKLGPFLGRLPQEWTSKLWKST